MLAFTLAIEFKVFVLKTEQISDRHRGKEYHTLRIIYELLSNNVADIIDN